MALADVTVENRIAVTGTGIMSAGNMSGTTKTTISGERSRSDSDIQLQSKVVRMFAHGAVGPPRKSSGSTRTRSTTST